MIECTLFFQFANGSGSDSLKMKVSLQALPREGETLIIGDISNVVAEVVHVISPESGEHSINIHYKEEE
jgi:hypothetical protein